MASIRATFHSIDEPFSHSVPSPAHWPSWSCPHQNTLTTGKSFVGQTVTWSCERAVRRVISINPSQSTHVCTTLTHFPSVYAEDVTKNVDIMQDVLSNRSRKSVTLCVANGDFVTMSTPEEDHLECSIPPLQIQYPWLISPAVSALFPLPAGLLIEVMSSNDISGSSSDPKQASCQRIYYYLAQQLDEMNLVSLPSNDHRVVFTSPDIPIIVTCEKERVFVWRIQAERIPISFSSSIAPSINYEEKDNPIASFVTSAYPGDRILASSSMPDIPEEQLDVIPRQTKLILNKLLEVPVKSTVNISVLIAHDISGDPVLCLLSNNSFYGLAMKFEGTTVTSVTQSFRIPDVANATSVLAVRRPQSCLDILVQHQTGGISLFAGKNRLCSVELGPVPECATSYNKAEASNSFSISAATGTEFHVIRQKGISMRYSLQSTCFYSPLVNSCISAISFQLHALNMGRITSFYHDLLTTKSRYSTVNYQQDDNIDREWKIFEEMILTTMPGGTSPRYLNDDNMDCDTDSDNGKFCQGGDADWNVLLKSGYHQVFGLPRLLGPVSLPENLIRSSPNSIRSSKISNRDILHNILQALHFLYEDHKMNSLEHIHMKNLAVLNSQVAVLTGSYSYIDYYRRDFSDIVISFSDVYPLPGFQEDEEAPSIFDYLACRLQKDRDSQVFFFPEWISLGNESGTCSPLHASWRARNPYQLSKRIIRYFEYLRKPKKEQRTGTETAHLLLEAMVKDKFTRAELDSLPFGVSVPLRDALWICRQAPKNDWTYNEFALIGREDLFNYEEQSLKFKREAKEHSTKIAQSRTLLQIQAAASCAPVEHENIIIKLSDDNDNATGNGEGTETSLDQDVDGCEMTDALHKLRFCEDKRTDEVRRVLRSTDPTLLTQSTNTDRDNGGDPDLAEDLKRKLEVLLRKRYAAPVGRGAFTLRTYAPSDPTKALPIPNVCMNGKLFDSECTLSITCPDKFRFYWGEFHNGVAAGLRLIAANNDRQSDTSQILTRSWIVNHKPADISGSASHAGMLLALGLGGYLPALKKTDYYRYLVPRHDLTSIGLMLGLSAGNIGSMNENITKMLCLHIRYFNRTGFSVPEFHVSINVQSAAILGLGLLHQGSCENLIIEGLFTELSRRPKPGDFIDNRESLALSAGLSIGILCLGHGTASFDTADGRHVDQLLLLANGGSGKAIGMSAQNGDLRADPIPTYDRTSNTTPHSEASRVMEGPFVNTDVVSSGALLALALVFLKTNNSKIAERITLPETSYQLDRSHPNHVYLKILARCLIMWDDITPTSEWILKIIPALLRPASDSSNPDPFDILGKIGVGTQFSDNEMDITGILQARAFAVAGACTAIALKYAGTSDLEVIGLLSKACEAFEQALLSQEKDANVMDWTCMSCMCAATLALSIVAAGSGSLSVLKLLRRLRKRRGKTTSEGRFGSHMAIHMAIGFLFLGGGCQTFGSSDIAIAGLLCAIYPRFPRDINDNQYHLQPLRHLYVLAIEPRCLDTRDVNTGNSCCVDIELTLKNGLRKKMRAPCILPSAKSIEQISVVSERYLYNTIKVNAPIAGKGWFSNIQHQIIHVKRRTGHLPYKIDPKGSKGILARSLHRLQISSALPHLSFDDVNHLVRAFRADPEVLAFVRYFCAPSSRRILSSHQSRQEYENFRHYASILYECLSMDKQEAIKIYIDAERARDSIASHSGCPTVIGSLTLLDAYIHSDYISTNPLVRPAFLKRIIDDARSSVDHPQTRHDLLEYIRSGGKRWPEFGKENEKTIRFSQDLSNYLQLNRFPQLQRLTELSTFLKQSRTKLTNSEFWDEICQTISTPVQMSALEAFVKAAKHN